MSTPNTNSSGWGWLILILVGLSLFGVMRFRDQARNEEQAAKAAQEKAEAERKLREFAENHLPELQKLMDDVQNEITERQLKLQKIREKLDKLNVNVDRDPQFVRWQDDLHQLRKQLDELRSLRVNAYKDLVLWEHSPNRSVKEDTEREARLDNIRGAVKKHEQLLKESIRRSEQGADDDTL